MKQKIFIIILLVVLLNMCFFMFGFKVAEFYFKEKDINEIKYLNNGFNYLALGNSITIHSKCDYWWNEIGMAATKKENDYYNLIIKSLEKKYKVKSYAYNFYIWEVLEHDRSESFSLIDRYLDDRLDLITLQLSENAVDLSTFKDDYIELINYLKNKCPKATIVIIDDFWSDEKSQIKKEVSELTNVLFADLTEIRNEDKYKAGLNTVVYGDDNKKYVIEHSGVAKHPGDSGMEYISSTVLDLLN